MRFEVIEGYKNLFDKIIPKEFSKEEIDEIRTVFPKAYSLKSASLYNPENLLSASCQWYDDKLFVEDGFERKLTILKGEVWISYYEVVYDRPYPLQYLPNQYGLHHFKRKWETIEDLIKIRDRKYD